MPPFYNSVGGRVNIYVIGTNGSIHYTKAKDFLKAYDEKTINIPDAIVYIGNSLFCCVNCAIRKLREGPGLLKFFEEET